MSSTTESVPLLVWGGGSGAVAAAVQAARSGANTLLLTPGPWLGGMVSAAGVCAPDGNELSPWQTGLWGALLRQLAIAEPTGLDHNWVSCFGFRPATAEAVLRRWVAAEEHLHWLANCELVAVERRDDRLHSVTVRRAGAALTLRPQLVIDGSDLGDLLAHGAAASRWGWESQETWNEPSAPRRQQLNDDPFFARQPIQSPTWVVYAQLRPGTSNPPKNPPLKEPFAEATAAFGLERTLTYGRLPGDLLMLNWPLQGNDWHNDLPPLFTGTCPQQRQHRQSLTQRMQAHSLAFAEALCEAAAGVVQLAEAFPDPAAQDDSLTGTSALALMPYWREGRRLEGLCTVIEQDLLPVAAGASRGPMPSDGQHCSSIAVGNYANDHHYPGPDWPLAAKSCRWGGRWSGTPFCVPYGALVSATTSNLLVADKAISVSHMANGATRLQPLVLNLGQAAGLAAALCLQERCLPAELPVHQLQRALIDDPQAPAGPFPVWDTPWHHPQWRQRQQACLEHPERLSADGRLEPFAGGEIGVSTAQPPWLLIPPEPHEQLFVGRFAGDLQQGYTLETADRIWPLITLEPALHDHLAQLAPGSQLQAIGCPNPWGPWLRLSRLQT